MTCEHFLFLEILINWNINKNFNSHYKYQLTINAKGGYLEESRV